MLSCRPNEFDFMRSEFPLFLFDMREMFYVFTCNDHYHHPGHHRRHPCRMFSNYKEVNRRKVRILGSQILSRSIMEVDKIWPSCKTCWCDRSCMSWCNLKSLSVMHSPSSIKHTSSFIYVDIISCRTSSCAFLTKLFPWLRFYRLPIWAGSPNCAEFHPL